MSLFQKSYSSLDRHADRVAKVEDAVKQGVEEQPTLYNGQLWAAVVQEPLAAYCGISVSTLTRIISKPPFVRDRTHVGGSMTLLLRLGTPGPKTVKDIADEMSKLFQQHTGHRPSPSDYGCLMGLAELWGHAAPAIFKTILADWSGFMSCVKLSPGWTIEKHYRFPVIGIMLKFAKTGWDFYVMTKQEAGEHEAVAAKVGNLMVPLYSE
jgi:hypothetical protein